MMDPPLLLFLSSACSFYCYSCLSHLNSTTATCKLEIIHRDDDEAAHISAIVKRAGLCNVGYDYPPLLNMQASFAKPLALDTIVATLYNSLLAASSRPRFRRELLVMKDGATVGIDWLESDSSSSAHRSNDTLVLLHHGLCGSSGSPYIVSTIRRLRSAGYSRICVFVARGCGGVPLTTPQSFNASRTSDIGEVLRHVTLDGADKALAIGYSLGAGVLLNYIGAAADNEPYLIGAVATSPAWNFLKKTAYFEMWSRFCLVNALKFYVLKNLRHLWRLRGPKLSILRLLLSSNIASFDHHAIVEAWEEHPSVEDYYINSSAVHKAANISIPTLSVSAINDPVCAHEGAPTVAEMGKGLVVAKTTFGGHVTFPVGALMTGESFADDLAVRFFRAIVEEYTSIENAVSSV